MPYHFDHQLLIRAPDPYPLLAALRESAPVYWSPELKGWLLTRYEDVKRSFRDPRYSVNRMAPFFDRLSAPAAAELHDLKTLIPLWLVFRDPPEHSRLRRVMNQGFTPTALLRLKSKVEALVDQLIDAMLERREVDFIRDFALLLPGYVILDLLGLPREDLGLLKPWSDDLQVFIGGAQAMPDKHRRAQHGTLKMAEYFRAAIASKRAQPGADDLLSLLVKASDAEGQLSEDELISICILVLFGGHETTTNLLGNGFLALLRNPEQFEALRADSSLAANAVEECLRYDGPGGANVRIVTVDHELGGQLLRKGDRVFAMVTAANRDPSQFEDPDRFDILRKNVQHLSFGQGIHFCLGAPLARIEATAALPRLVARLQGARVTSDALDWRDAIVQRGLHSLPLQLP
ncbi:MAG: pksS [Gammaproteobacteria bacterium]|jgi:cytochrome P450|nr:pksS [Gammaproteobacteria bacterium]MEA3179156.1 hypothetical protein [Gammaproteobacteria bacterium]